MLNTVIFLIAGCKLGALMSDASFYDLFLMPHFRSMLILIYPIILFARGLAILLAFPLLKRLGTGCTWKDAIVMWWGGLRGSVGLALGLSVHHMMYDSSMWGTDHATSGGLETLNCRDQPMMVLWLTVLVVTSTVISTPTAQSSAQAPLRQLSGRRPADRIGLLSSSRADVYVCVCVRNLATSQWCDDVAADEGPQDDDHARRAALHAARGER